MNTPGTKTILVLEDDSQFRHILTKKQQRLLSA